THIWPSLPRTAIASNNKAIGCILLTVLIDYNLQNVLHDISDIECPKFRKYSD
uniref:ZP domain-containing protein n=1 Tax=Parascaris univalens TaxID=6257 RepID=A0A915AUT9_PARUN